RDERFAQVRGDRFGDPVGGPHRDAGEALSKLAVPLARQLLADLVPDEALEPEPKLRIVLDAVQVHGRDRDLFFVRERSVRSQSGALQSNVRAKTSHAETDGGVETHGRDVAGSALSADSGSARGPQFGLRARMDY